MSCPVLKAKCDDNELVDSMIKFVDTIEKNPAMAVVSISKTDLKKTKDALNKYKKDCTTCMSEAGGDYKCMLAAKTNLSRRIPMLGNSIYPWKNFDWNYGNHVSNNYAPKYTGAKVKPTIKQAYKNAIAFTKIVDGLIADPIPNSKSKAGERNRASDYPPMVSCDKDYKCTTTQNVKRGYRQKRPTKDSFLNNKVDGEYSSSYYFKVGTCPRHDIKKRKVCEKKGYTWVPNIFDKIVKSLKSKKGNDGQSNTGSCHQPRYAFIDNSPKAFFNGSNLKGFIPAIASDLMALAPDKLIGSLLGASVANSYTIQPCKNTREKFTNNNSTNNNSTNNSLNKLLYVMLIIITLIIVKKLFL
jgi:hypothetical protein